MKSTDQEFLAYWGKAGKEEKKMEVHLLPYHCLDVAAVGQVLLNRQGRMRSTLSNLTGLDEPDFTRCMVFLLSLHDVGKFAECFQNLREDLLESLQGKRSEKGYGLRHDTLGFLVWCERIRQSLEKRNVLPSPVISRRRRRETGYDIWMRAIAGHHGEPPKDENRLIKDFFSEQDLKAAECYTDAASELLLGVEGTLPLVDKSSVREASWWLAGLAVLCDWLGSNAEFFPACSTHHSLSEYWSIAIERAERAVAAVELVEETPSRAMSLQELYAPDIEKPTPLQRYCGDMPIPAGPQLHILEDVTGSGKTEAAVLLAHRLMVQNGTIGMYFALPTMATANAMYERMQHVYRRLFPAKIQPCLVLAHSARNLSKIFRQSVLPQSDTEPNSHGDNTVPASAHCSAWLADNAKKALLAAVGVGTIDQALLGILPSRHQGLRLLGLMNKILVVDEVHACDAYMHTLLKALLQAQARAGGSAVLLSATLPNQQRQALVEAFAQGCKAPSPTLKKTGYDEYPLLTCWSEGEMQEVQLETRDEVRRYVQVEMIYREKDVKAVLKKAIAAGQCACWIRNTVADARQSYANLRRQFPEWVIDLFHARFAMGDRLEIEERILEQFGKKSTAGQRRGRLLIATQVVEQSLDVDFDVMVTDLAPIDLIIQRAGRLQRHARSANGDRIDAADERGIPVLNLLSPNPVDEPNSYWCEALFVRGSRVYPNHGQLWLTARLLKERGGFKVPEDIRTLTEGVFGEEATASIPEGLLERTFEAEGQDWANISVAELNVLNFAEGYSAASSNRWWDEAMTPTRLGEPTTAVYVAQWKKGRLSPWVGGIDQPWQRSMVQIRMAHIEAEADVGGALFTAMEACRGNMPAAGKWGVLLPLEAVDEFIWRGAAKNAKGDQVAVYYSRELGLIMEEEMLELNEGVAYEPD